MSLDLPEDPYHRTTPDGDHVALTYLPLDELHELNRVRCPSAGALCSFIGTTRDTFGGKTVLELEYEAYPSMALNTMMHITREARELSLSGAFSFDWPSHPAPRGGPAASATSTSPSAPLIDPPKADLVPQLHTIASLRQAIHLTRISLVHRLGTVPPAQSSISIHVSSPHRKEAFRACEWILEEVKKRVQVWKREVYAPVDGTGEREKAWKENFPA